MKIIQGTNVPIKMCPKCGKKLLKDNKTGFCNKHHDRTGKNNPFFGHHHTEEFKKENKVRCKINSTLLWKNPQYRNKVIKGTSKPRKKEFKKEQSERITKWYEDNPEQRELRSISMHNNWKRGLITSNGGVHINHSKKQALFYTLLKEKYDDIVQHYTIHDQDKWFFPDIISTKDNIIIEYYGDYWHANPKKYSENQIVHHNLTAKRIWDIDKERINRLEKLGYWVYIIWEGDFISNKNDIINKFDSIFNWEGCSI